MEMRCRRDRMESDEDVGEMGMGWGEDENEMGKGMG